MNLEPTLFGQNLRVVYSGLIKISQASGTGIVASYSNPT